MTTASSSWLGDYTCVPCADHLRDGAEVPVQTTCILLLSLCLRGLDSGLLAYQRTRKVEALQGRRCVCCLVTLFV